MSLQIQARRRLAFLSVGAGASNTAEVSAAPDRQPQEADIVTEAVYTTIPQVLERVPIDTPLRISQIAAC